MKQSLHSLIRFVLPTTIFFGITLLALPSHGPDPISTAIAASYSGADTGRPTDPAPGTDTATVPPLAVAISDVHIGERYGGITGNPADPDSYCQLGDPREEGPSVRCEFISFLEYCRDLKQKHGKIEYLIIMGDMWDLAMNNQEDSFAQSVTFFQQLNEQDTNIGLGALFENIIYIPGNHDHHFWEMLQEKYWVTERIEQGLPPLTMPRTVSLTVDIASGDILHNDNTREDGGIPAHNIVSSLLGLDTDTPVHVAYPHAFLQGSNGEHILVTHGHLLEPNWNMVTIMFGDLMQKQGIPLTIRNIEMFNAITTDWHSYSFGQTPPYEFWEEIYDHHFDSQPPTQWERTFFDILKAHVKANDVRGDPTTPSIKYHSIEALEMERGLLEHYLAQTKADFLKDGDEITALVYGHTHIPAFKDIFVRHHGDKKSPLWVHNTGGWVDIDADKHHLPAPILIYRDGSVRELAAHDEAF
jgi:UDP-2,3-diacylglucosamine pyrophosphatase LpxH